MLKRVPVEELRVGMFIEDFDVSWIDHPFLGRRKRLASERDIRVIREHGLTHVYINTDGLGSAKPVAPEEPAESGPEEILSAVGETSDSPSTPSADRATYHEELRRARRVHAKAKLVVQDLLRDARMGKSVDGEKATRVVDEMIDSIFRNPDALTSLSRLKSFDEYTFHHSVNVCVLSLALGRHLGIVKGELRALGVGALLHDFGKVVVPPEILNKRGRLSEEEFQRVKAHPLHGAKMLLQCSELSEACATVALNHHERFDGRGYPRGLKGLAIGKFGLISAIVDVYDAITSDRVYHRAVTGHEAVKKIYEWGKTDFHPLYVQKFIQCLGIYPTGSVVRLDTGEIGVVSKQNPEHLLRPWVSIVRDPSGVPLAAPVDFSLSTPRSGDGRSYARSIVAALGADAAPGLERFLEGNPVP